MTYNVLLQIQAERQRQLKKFGPQNDLPSVSYSGEYGYPARFGMPDERWAKANCDDATQRGELTSAHICVEELSEAIQAKNDADRRVELVQLATCVMAWIERIDRKAAGK
jgi:hypothetical protein